MLDLVLRLARLECRRQVSPESVEPRIRHFEDPADVLRALAIKKHCRLGAVAVSTRHAVAVALEQAKCDEGVQKVVRSARIEVQVAFKFAPSLRPTGKVGEDTQLYSAQQRLRCPESHADLHDVIWRDLTTRHCQQLGVLHGCVSNFAGHRGCVPSGITHCSTSGLDDIGSRLIRLFRSVAAEADKAFDLLALQPEVPQSIVIERPEMIDRTPCAELGDRCPDRPPKISAQKGSPDARTAKERRRAVCKKSLS